MNDQLFAALVKNAALVPRGTSVLLSRLQYSQKKERDGNEKENTACSIANWTGPYEWSSFGLSNLLWNMLYMLLGGKSGGAAY